MNDDCLFCKIIKHEIPAKIAFEDQEILAFEDINPQAPIHLLVIPMIHISRISELTEVNASLIAKLIFTANQLAKENNIIEKGYRLVVNCNEGAGQTVFHIHLHLLGGRDMKWPPG